MPALRVGRADLRVAAEDLVEEAAVVGLRLGDEVGVLELLLGVVGAEAGHVGDVDVDDAADAQRGQRGPGGAGGGEDVDDVDAGLEADTEAVQEPPPAIDAFLPRTVTVAPAGRTVPRSSTAPSRTLAMSRGAAIDRRTEPAGSWAPTSRRSRPAAGRRRARRR